MDYGSRKPLNWKGDQLAEPVKKSVSHEEKLATYSRHETPPTRQGAFNGQMPGLKPATPAELNPSLTIRKAVTAPVSYKPDGKAQFQRKRGQDGKFADAENSGTESTAQDDSEKQERSAKLQQHKMNDKLVDVKQRASEVMRGVRPKNPSVKDNHEKDGRVDKSMPGQVPGLGSADGTDMQNDPSSKQIGVTKMGGPIFDDPAHSEHGAFTPEDHGDAANLNRMMASNAASQGDQAGAMQYQNNAGIHDAAGQDSANPGSRFLDNLMNPAVQTPSMAGLPQDDLSNLMGGQPQDPSAMPGMGSTAPMGMGADPTQQNAGMPPAPPTPAMPPGQDMGAPAAPPAPAPQDPMQSGAQAPDALSQFTDPTADQNKPMSNPPIAGPAPGMVNSQTSTGVGPQTTSADQFAGTAQQPVPSGAAQAPIPPTGDQMQPGAMPQDPSQDDGGGLNLDDMYAGDEQAPDDQDGVPPDGDADPDDAGLPQAAGDDAGGGLPQDAGTEPTPDSPPPSDKDKDKVAKAIKALSRWV